MTNRKQIRITLSKEEAKAFERLKQKAEDELMVQLSDGKFAALLIKRLITAKI